MPHARPSTSTESVVGQVRRVVDLADYQAGGIVSRQIVKMPAGSITIFAFDEGQELTEHTSSSDALVHVLEGEAEITVAGQAHRAQSGEMIVLSAHVPHSVKAVTRFKMLLTMVRPG